MRRLCFLSVLAVLGGALATGCFDTGADRVLEIEATGTVQGLVFFDANGTRELEETDPLLAAVGVRLLALGTRDTAARAATNASGIFSIARVPVGSYELVVDPATGGDSAQVVRIDPPDITVTPDDSVVALIAVSFPIASVTEARALASGERVFVEGITLNGRETFGDSTVHLADRTAAIRATRVRRFTLLAGDSVRFLGTSAQRDGQPVLDDVTPFFIEIVAPPPPEVTTTAAADAADGGRLDAALVRAVDAVILDTATTAGDLLLTVDDGSGPLGVLLDQDAPFTSLDPFLPDTVIDATGVLVPTAAGNWQLKPRSDDDLVVK